MEAFKGSLQWHLYDMISKAQNLSIFDFLYIPFPINNQQVKPKRCIFCHVLQLRSSTSAKAEAAIKADALS